MEQDNDKAAVSEGVEEGQSTSTSRPLPSLITKENVARINTETVPLPSPEAGLHFDRTSQYVSKFPIRESSSAFLASMTSASDVSSPLMSAFASTDSLQSSQPSDNDDNAIPGNKHKGSMIEMAMPLKTDTSIADDSSSGSTSRLQPDSPENISHTIVPSPERLDSQPDSLSPIETQHKSPITQDDKTFQESELKTPSRTHTPAQSAYSTPGEYAHPIHGREYYSSGKHDEDYEQSHSKTPLLYPSDHPAPRETEKVVKDWSDLGNKLINQYEALKKLGSGAHGTVKLGIDTTAAPNDPNRYVAIKVVKRSFKRPRLGKSESPEDKVKKEVAVLKKAQHPHVVSLLEVIDDPDSKKVYLILEYVSRGEIKWRKPADRDIANFEMNRMKRDVLGDLDEAAETEHLLTFNDALSQKHYRQDSRSVTNSSTSEGYQEDFSIEDHADTRLHRVQSRQSSQPSSRPASRPPSELDISTPYTLRIPSRTSNRDAHGLDQELNGSMYGSYIEEESLLQANDFDHNRWLHDEPAEDQQWSQAEEEYRYVPCLTLSEARDVFRDTVLGLEYLHYHGIIHRDIKPANLLWTEEYRVKISDFGVSYLGRALSDENDESITNSGQDVSVELAKTVGTPAFYAPELCDPDLFDPEKYRHRPQITGQIDVWALGITLYAMIYGRLPFYDQNEFSMYEKIARHEVLIPSKRLRGVNIDGKPPTNSNKREEHILMYEDVNDELRDLLRRLLIKDPEKRITIKEVKHHPWVLRHMAEDWIQVTDPAYKGDRIQVSQADLREAVVPRTFLGKVWSGITNMTRGRVPSRRRAETSSKNQAKRLSSSMSRSNVNIKEPRRSSLRSDDPILMSLRNTREGSEHPLSRSTVVTPTAERHGEFFPPIHQVDSQGNLMRPPPRTANTADSILTIRASRELLEAKNETLATQGIESGGSSSGSLAKLIDGTKEATRRITSRVRNRDNESKSDQLSVSSRASSRGEETLLSEGRNLKPSLAMSPAIASGHFEAPPSLHPESITSSGNVSPISQSPPITGSLNTVGRGRASRKRASTASTANAINTTSWGHVSPGFAETHRIRLANSPHKLGHSPTSTSQFLPLTGAVDWNQPQPQTESIQSTPAYAATSDASASLLTTGETITPEVMKQKQAEREEYRQWRAETQRLQQDRYRQATQPRCTDEHDHDDGSDDDGIMMGGGKKK